MTKAQREAVKRRKEIAAKRVINSGQVSGWLFNDKLALTQQGFYDKNRNPKQREYNSTKGMR